jgi:3-oxoadipate enol-lactonase
VHAAVGDRGLWDAQFDVFAERFRVVRYDLRGFGDSPLPGGPFSYVADLSALLDHLGIERAALVGNSLGGRVALDLALAQPERVSALVLVAGALGGRAPSPELEALDAEEDALLEAGRIDDAVELNLRTWLSDGLEPALRTRVAAMARRAFTTLLAAHEREPAPGPVAWLDPPAAVRLPDIGAPTLVVVGSEDVADFLAIADRLAAEIPGARQAVVAGAGHLPGLEQPNEFNRVVLEFLATVPGEPPR